MKVSGCLLLLLACAGVASARSLPPPEKVVDADALAELNAAKELWARVGPSSYVLKMALSCVWFCEVWNPLLVTVENGTIVDVSYAPGGPAGSPPDNIKGGAQTVEGVFAHIEEAINSKADVVEVTYDNVTGAPLNVSIDNFDIADDEFSYQIEFVDSPTEPTPAQGQLTELEGNRSLWTSTRPENYTMEISLSCFCPPDFTRTYIQTIQGDTVVDVQVTQGEPSNSSPQPTVDGLFSEIESALRDGAETVEVTYNTKKGFPESVFIDVSQLIADEERSYSVKLIE